MEYIKLNRENLIEIGILDRNDNPTGESIILDVENINLPLRLDECMARHEQNAKKVKFDLAVIDKKQDVHVKGRLMSENNRAKFKILNDFYKAEIEALDLFLGENGTHKMLAGQEPYITMFDDIMDAIKPYLPKLKNNYNNLSNKIKEKYNIEKIESNIVINEDE